MTTTGLAIQPWWLNDHSSPLKSGCYDTKGAIQMTVSEQLIHWIFKKYALKSYSHSFRIAYDKRAVSLLESRVLCCAIEKRSRTRTTTAKQQPQVCRKARLLKRPQSGVTFPVWGVALWILKNHCSLAEQRAKGKHCSQAPWDWKTLTAPGS